MTKPSRQAKPIKPHGSPLTVYGNGQFGKQIRGKVYYFGPWHDHDAALAEYLRVKADLEAGRIPRPKASKDALAIEDMVNLFLDSKLKAVERGDLQYRTWQDYRAMGQMFVKCIGRGIASEHLSPTDFQDLNNAVAKAWGPVRRGKFVGFVRMVYKWAYESGHIAQIPRFGPDFVPPEKAVRMNRGQARTGDLSAQLIRKLIDRASPAMKAMILLGINCAFGNWDCARLPLNAINRKAKLIDWPRPKTHIPRVATLWPETLKAIDEYEKVRPAPHDESDAGLLFITKYGNAWARFDDESKTDSVALEFRKLMREVAPDLRGINFYALRRTFRTLASETKDREAVLLIMGHAWEGMDEHYLLRIGVPRLRAVTDHVRSKVFKRTAVA